MAEFRKGDVLAEIGNTKIYWVVSEVSPDGYYMDVWFDNAFHKSGVWFSFRSGSRTLVKVDEWDWCSGKMKGIDDA